MNFINKNDIIFRIGIECFCIRCGYIWSASQKDVTSKLYRACPNCLSETIESNSSNKEKK